MKIKYKMSLILIAVMAVIISGISFMLLRQASKISTNLSVQGMMYLNDAQSEFWKGYTNGNLRVLHTLADIMSRYESLAPELRRSFYNEILRTTLETEEGWVVIYTAWKPNALDSMDAYYTGWPGAGSEGQYAINFNRETGRIETRTASDYNDAIAYISGPNARKDRVLPPVSRTVMGREAFLVRMMVPIINHRTNEVVGGVGCLFDTAGMQPILERVIEESKEIAAMSVYANDGFILAHYSPDRIGKNLVDVDRLYGDYTQEAFLAVQNGEEFHCKSYSYTLKSNVEIDMMPVRIGNSDMTWTVMLASTESYILSEVNAMTIFTVVLAAAVILITVLGLFFLMQKMTNPIIEMADTLMDIAEGEGDLTHVIPVNGNDEIARMAIYFNETLEKIKKMVINIKAEAGMLSDLGRDLASNMNETAAAVNEITANIQSAKDRMINQSTSVSETNATMEQITLNINKLSDHVEKQAVTVSEGGSAIEQMLANIQSVTQTLVKNGENVKELTNASEVGRTGLEEVAEDIQKISRESEGLLEINAVMENVASQTNLLSMNAAIEAAHAGEAGKGFAVVAEEIRKLAESSSEQSKTISDVLQKIKNSIDKISVSTDNVLQKFEAIDTRVKTVAEQEESIRYAMEEQSEGSKQVLEAVSLVNDVTQLVKAESMEMLMGSREVIREAANLEKVTQELTGGMNEMALGANEINIAVNSVNDLSLKNRDVITSLVQEVSRFKVE